MGNPTSFEHNTKPTSLIFLLGTMQVKFGFIDDATSLAAMSLADLTFIIEEPRPSFFSKDCKHRDSPISVCWDRWRHIQTFHFVYASPRQATLYSRLDVPHYSESAHIMKSEISKFKRAYPGLDCISVYHLSHQNLTSPFLTVFNELPTDVETIFQQIHWEAVVQTRHSEEKISSKAGASSTGHERQFRHERQFLYADFGNTSNTSGLNQSRLDNPLGLPCPVLLKGTAQHSGFSSLPHPQVTCPPSGHSR